VFSFIVCVFHGFISVSHCDIVIPHRVEVSLALGISTTVQLNYTIADTVILQPYCGFGPILPGRWRESSCLGPDPFGLHVIHFAAEYKSASSAANRIIYDLSTALYHKRALGLKTQTVFGTSSAEGPHVAGWIACWDNDVVCDNIM
jgi:hypothetical protein